MQEMKLIDAVAAETAIKDFFKKQIDEEYLYLEVTDCNADILAVLNALPSVPVVPLDVHERMKRELNEEKQALIAGQETLQKALAEKNEEIENRIQNFKALFSDHRTLQQSFDNLKSLYEAEKAKVEKAKEKCVYFAKEVQKAHEEIEAWKLKALSEGKTTASAIRDEFLARRLDSERIKKQKEIIAEQDAELKRFKQIETTVNEFWCVLQKFSKEKLKEKPTLEELLEYIEQVKSEAIKEFMDSAIERVEKARQKYQRLCREQGEEIDEAMNIHFNGMVNILKETAGDAE